MTRNVDLVNNRTILSSGTEYRNETYYNIVFGTDYHINETNLLTLSGNFAMEIEDQPSSTAFAAIGANGETNAEWDRDEVTEPRCRP
ncbi:hypothetical protein SAMN04487911_1405 [Arenibacter nanhaiticus]|uniref:Uncharacterized protein n=1 Tax=Arenibacter nanhaiticus TaxID=558155 RepID=A0A1M6MC45_9FLAO|nr:hypothetical protein [Arenibacter nanhaiticus]SHJ81014.1 hypothetical protein SAMN04487911_1405 [Arenibacter nanhaiticus]